MWNDVVNTLPSPYVVCAILFLQQEDTCSTGSLSSRLPSVTLSRVTFRGDAVLANHPLRTHYLLADCTLTIVQETRAAQLGRLAMLCLSGILSGGNPSVRRPDCAPLKRVAVYCWLGFCPGALLS